MGKLREFSDKVSEFADSKGLANPIEVIDEALGGQTREESKARRAKAKPAPEPQKPVEKAKGGMVSDAAHKKALTKAGFYDKDKTTSERKKIVSKVTTKPQRLGIVEKLFSAKKMKAGGMASKRADGIAIKGKTRA